MTAVPELPNEIEALMPWYATGRLSAEDRAKVATALQDQADLTRQMRFIEEVRQAAIRLNEDISVPGNPGWDRIAAVVATEPRRAP